jgi:predicted nucleotidyltransferase
MADISQKWLSKIDNKELKVFGIFCCDYKKRSHGNGVAKQLKMPQRSILRKLDNLCEKGILKFERIGKNKEYSINWDNPAIFHFLIFAESYKAVNFSLKNPKISMILNEINCDKIIFGSYANSTNTKNSDLDIVLLCKEDKKINDILSKSSIKIHAQFSTLNELKKKLNEEDSLAVEIANNHIIFNDLSNLIKAFMKYHLK